VNDVVVARGGAYSTDSFQPFLYRIPIAPNGALGAASQAIPLTGDIVYGPGFNANGIDATPNGKTLIIVQSNTGKLFTVDPSTRRAASRARSRSTSRLRPATGSCSTARRSTSCGTCRTGVAVVALAPDLSSGTVGSHIMDSTFDVPTTIAEFGHRLYAVNARFTTPPGPTTSYSLTQVEKVGT
jgi:sugar lactone lactonase YvrE